jgi:glycosyltransferase involved in cell wall biosynthesis
MPRPRRADLGITFVTHFRGRSRGGIGRYEDALLGALRPICRVEARPIERLPLPSLLFRVGDLVGRDVAAVLDANPLYVRAVYPGTIVHLTSQTLAGNLLWQRHRAGTVVTVHDIMPIVGREQGWFAHDAGLLPGLLERQMLRGLRRADRIIADSAATRDDLVRFLGIADDRIRVAHLGVDQALFGTPGPDDAATLGTLGLGATDRYVLYAGSLLPHKNVATLLAAFGRLREQLPDVSLVIAGAPRVQPGSEVDGMCRRGLARMTGPISDAQLSALYRGAALFVLPSLYEGFGLPVLEAMASGCPTLSAATSSIPEIVGDAGLMFDPRDEGDLARAMRRVLEDPPLADRLRRAGRARAAEFTWRRTAETTAAVYEEVSELVSAGRRGPAAPR